MTIKISTFNINSIKMRSTIVTNWLDESKTDILLMQETKSIDENFPKKEFKNWIFQKKRHHTTNFKYKKKHKILLGIQYLSALVFYFLLLISFFSIDYSGIGLLLFIFRYFLFVVINYKAFKIMMCKDLLWTFPIYEIILLFCQPIFQTNKITRF